MGLPDGVAVKLDAYALFCRQLLTYLPALRVAAGTDQPPTCDECCRYLDEELQQFFRKAAPRDLQQAVEQLGKALLSHVGYFQDRNPQAAAVFHQVVEAASAIACTWRCQDDLETIHQQGQQLARHFYAESPWPATQARLNQEAQLILLYEKGAEVAFRQHYPDEETDQELIDVMLVRVTFDHDFGLYLAYPFLFMHEYVSHIFALDYGNERFNDGWLLHAADAFLTRQGWDLALDSPLSREQIAAFGECLYHTRLNQVPRSACHFARQFDAWLGDPKRFLAMTWELAAFEPREGESDFWPNQFINRLEQEFGTDRHRLRREIEAAPDVRALYEMLPPV